MTNFKQLSQARARLLFILTTAALVSPGCSGWRGSKPARETAGVVTSTTPPFATKEPERYQAVRITTITKTSTSVPAETQTVRVFIARDGEKRREGYENSTGEQSIYLENAQGRYLLLPAKNSYANLSATDTPPDSRALADQAAEVSVDRLLHESPSEARYEKLGIETLNGRTTTKFRVTRAESNTGSGAESETLIWIDEQLGLPIRSETTFSRDHNSKVLMELRDISLDVDARLFELPEDYKQIALPYASSPISKAERRESPTQGKGQNKGQNP